MDSGDARLLLQNLMIYAERRTRAPVAPLDEVDSIAGDARLLRQTSAYQLYPQFHGADFTPRSFRATTQFANLVRFLRWGREFDFNR
jgi:hypothetical protein